jgi:hypothetical protein
MNISSIFSARNVSLLVFILVVLFLGATFDVKVGPESFESGDIMSKLMSSTSTSAPKEPASTSAPKKTDSTTA